MAREIVVVTGAAGFIGSRLVARLLDDGVMVRALVHYGVESGHGLLDDFGDARRSALDVRAGDLRDADWVRRALAGAGRVFHLGALVSIPYSYRSPRDVVDTNVVGTLNVLEAARDAGVTRVIHTSTSEVYGSAQVIPMSEQHPLSAQSPYAASKIAADQLALSWWKSFGLPVSVVRPFNTFGPGQSARAIVPTVITQALAGSTVRLGAVTPTRDFNYVDDTVAGFVAVSSSESAVGEVFNVGTGVETSVAELVVLVGAALGKRVTVESDDERMRPAGSEVTRLNADATKLRTMCGWEPKVALAEGIARTIDWIRANPHRFSAKGYAV